MKFEDILQQIGDENRYQNFLIILLLLPTSFFNVFFEGMFLLSTPDHWCRVPELEHLSFEQQHSLIRPMDLNTGKPSNCEHHGLKYSDLLMNISTLVDQQNDAFKSFIMNSTLQTSTKIECNNGWIYDQSLYTETAVTWVCFILFFYSLVYDFSSFLFNLTKFNFVCGRSYYVNLIMSLTAIGLAVMTPLIANLSDR